MRMRGALAGSALVAALLACTTGSATAASDPGWFEGHSREERQAIVNYVYERTGHEPPHEGDPETMSAQITDSVLDAGEDEAPFASDVGGLELVVGTKVGLMTRLTTLIPSLPLVAGVGTFAAGYTQTVKLRWGRRAWGYRHIVLGHGWDASAAVRTALALADRSATVERVPGSYRYVATLSGGPRGVTCKQRVVVSYGQDELVPSGRHIITSFVDGDE